MSKNIELEMSLLQLANTSEYLDYRDPDYKICEFLESFDDRDLCSPRFTVAEKRMLKTVLDAFKRYVGDQRPEDEPADIDPESDDYPESWKAQQDTIRCVTKYLAK